MGYRKDRKVLIAGVFSTLMLLALLFGGIKYRTDYARKEIMMATSSEGRYSLIIYMIGEPDWPNIRFPSETMLQSLYLEKSRRTKRTY